MLACRITTNPFVHRDSEDSGHLASQWTMPGLPRQDVKSQGKNRIKSSRPTAPFFRLLASPFLGLTSHPGEALGCDKELIDLPLGRRPGCPCLHHSALILGYMRKERADLPITRLAYLRWPSEHRYPCLSNRLIGSQCCLMEVGSRWPCQHRHVHLEPWLAEVPP